MILYNVNMTSKIEIGEQHLSLFNCPKLDDGTVKLMVDGELFAYIDSMKNANDLVFSIKHELSKEQERKESNERFLINKTSPMSLITPGEIVLSNRRN